MFNVCGLLGRFVVVVCFEVLFSLSSSYSYGQEQNSVMFSSWKIDKGFRMKHAMKQKGKIFFLPDSLSKIICLNTSSFQGSICDDVLKNTEL